MSIEVGQTYKCENGRTVRINCTSGGIIYGYPVDEPQEVSVAYDGFGVPVRKALWDDGWALVLEEDWKCPHCGSTGETWFDRSYTIDADGNELEPMCTRCNDCGKDVDAPPDDGVNAPKHYTVGGIEAIDVIKAKLTPEEYRGYLKGNLLKYLMRANYKGDHDKDCKKAAYYGKKLEEAL
jgi:hypothetical protein